MSSSSPVLPSVAAIAQLIDHAILKPEFTRADVDAQLQIAADYAVFSVCVRPADVAYAAQFLAGTGVVVGTVIGFPHGTTSAAAKAAEAEQAIADGAVELDMVLNIGWLRSGMLAEVEADIRAVVSVARAAGGLPVKVILETVFLDDDQIVAGSQAAERAGARFVKTSTGFSGGGATLHDLALMRACVSPAVMVKASGGVRGLDTLLEMLGLGVDRFGTSATAAILDDVQQRLSGGGSSGAVDSTSY